MNFDDLYMLKLSIRISDFDNTNKYFKKLNKNKIRNDPEVLNFLFSYCNDLRIFKLFESDYNKYLNDKKKILILNLFSSNVNNLEIIKYVFENMSSSLKDEYFHYTSDSKSILINTLQNSNSDKKLKLFDYFLNNDFNFSNKNSQILIEKNPTNLDAVFLEKIENLLKYKNDNNSFLFNNKTYSQFEVLKISSEKDGKLIKRSIENYINTPYESYKINFADIEYNLLKLNIALRKMYDVNPIYLHSTKFDNWQFYNKIHNSMLDNFILDKILLDKI